MTSFIFIGLVNITRSMSLLIAGLLDASGRTHLSIRFMQKLLDWVEGRKRDSITLFSYMIMLQLKLDDVEAARQSIEKFLGRTLNWRLEVVAESEPGTMSELLKAVETIGKSGERIDDLTWPPPAQLALIGITELFHLEPSLVPTCADDVQHKHLEEVGRRAFDEWRKSRR